MSLYTQSLGRGPELVMIHGWGQNRSVWTETALALSKSLRITLVDLPGHGRSPLGSGDYSLAALAEQVAAVAPPRAAWLGWSLGGLVALYQAARTPQRLSALVLVASSAQLVRTPDWPHGIPAELLAQFAENLEQNYRATLHSFIALEAMGSPNPKQEIRLLRERLSREGEPQPEALRGGLRILQTADLRPLLARVDMPTLLLLGANDRLVPPQAGRELAKALPDARLHLIERAGHAPFLSQREEFVRAVREFVIGHG